MKYSITETDVKTEFCFYEVNIVLNLKLKIVFNKWIKFH